MNIRDATDGGGDGVAPWQWGRLGATIRDWVLGVGFLSFHVGLYLLAAVALVMLNLARAPHHLWVSEVLLPWGIVVLIQAVLVGIAAALANADRMIDAEEAADQGAATRPFARFDPRASGRFSVRPVVTVSDDEPPWRRTSRFIRDRVVRPTASKASAGAAAARSRLSERLDGAAPAGEAGPAAAWPKPTPAKRSPLARARATLAAGAGQARDIAGRAQESARAAVDQVQERLTAGAGDSGADNGPNGPSAPPAGPASSWPAAGPGRPGATAPPDNPGRPNPWGNPATAAHANPSPAPAQPTAAGGDGMGPPPASQPGLLHGPHTASDTEATWMEAAAAAWLARRAPEEGDPGSSGDRKSPPATPDQPPVGPP